VEWYAFFHQKKHSYLIFKIVTSVPDGTEEANPKVGRNVTSVTLPSDRLHADIHVSEIFEKKSTKIRRKKSTKIVSMPTFMFQKFQKSRRKSRNADIYVSEISKKSTKIAKYPTF
jgi:hypothetical protein